MPFHTALNEVLDFRSFSSLWYWIGVAVYWSTICHWILGVPFDLIHRARRHKDPIIRQNARRDVALLAQLHARRWRDMMHTSPSLLSFSATFALTSLAILGFTYHLQWAQAVFLLLVWMVPVGWLTGRLALDIAASSAQEDEIITRLRRLRFQRQALGILAIFLTALYGMWHNLNASVLY